MANPDIAIYGKATQFGQPGAPTPGRKPGIPTLQDRFNRYINLDTPVILPDGTKDKREVLDAAILALLHKATRGDIPAIKEVLDRQFGKLSDKVELTGKDGQPLQVNHVAHLEQLYGGMKDAFAVEAIEEK